MSDVNLAPEPSRETPPQDGPAAVADVNEKVAAKFKRNNIRPENPNYEAIVTDDASYQAVKPGAKYVDPKGDKRVKAWAVNSIEDYDEVPEGQMYIDPNGIEVKKPVFGPLNFTEQALYDMAPSASKKKVLEKYYPGKVQEDHLGLYIDEGDGKFKRPGATRGAGAFAGALVAETAPVATSAIGGLAGGAAGAAIGGASGAIGGPPGLLAGAVGSGLFGALTGAAIGGAVGQGFNDLVLSLNGIHPESAGQEALRLGGAGIFGLVGEGAGRAIAAAVPTIREGISKLTEQGIPWAANKALTGSATTKEELQLAEKLTSQGYPAPPSMVLKGAPRIQNAVESFRERYNLGAMRSELEPYYEQEATNILDKLGIEKAPGEKILHPTEAIGTEKAGQALQDRAIRELASADGALDAEIAAKRAGATAKAETGAATKDAVMKTAEETRVAAQKVVDEGFANIRKDVDTAYKLSEAGHKGGDLFGLVADKFKALRTGFGERANYWYDRFDQMTGGATVSSDGLASTAQKMLDELPAPFKTNNPALVQKLAKLAPQYDEAGQLVKPSEPVTYGELQKLRTLFRGASDWQTLSGDFKNGQLKFFSKEVDRLLHDPSAPEQVKSSVKFLDMVDKWYGNNIKIYDSEMIKAVQKGIASGEPADPAVLRDILLKEGHSALVKKTFDMMGPTLANAVRAADLDVMLQNSRTHLPGQIDAGRFYNEVISRYRNGLLEDVHGAERTTQLLKQAEYLKMLEGKLPVRVEPGDRIADVIAKSRAAKQAADDLARTDPLKTLSQEMKAIDAERKKRLSSRIDTEQLGFLYDPTYGAIKSVDTVLSHPDLILAAASKFKPESPEFTMLKQIYTKRILQSGDPAKALEKIPDSVQRIMFDLAYDDMKLLANEWKLITDSRAFQNDMAMSMMTNAKVQHPLGKIAGVNVAAVPGTAFPANSAWAAYYEMVTNWTAKNHWLMATLLKGARGDPSEKAAVREVLRKHAQKYGAMGAGMAESGYQQVDGSGE